MKRLILSVINAFAASGSHSSGATEIPLVGPRGIRAALEQMIPAFEAKTMKDA
jgi:hypothetical protein